MTTPFNLRRSRIFPNDHSLVSWSSSGREFVKSYILTDILFAVIKCETVGINVQLNSGDQDVMWLSSDAWAQDKSKNYSHYVQEMYVVTGVTFTQHTEAEQFYDWLNKRYMWELLSV